MTRKDKQIENPERRQPQPADLPEDTSIEAIAAYEKSKMSNPWNVQGMRDDMEYYFASKEPGYSPQNVQNLEMLGYVKSNLKHNNPELVLMECRKDIVKYRRTQDLLQDQKNRKQSFDAPKGIPEKSELGGVYRLPTHGPSLPE